MRLPRTRRSDADGLAGAGFGGCPGSLDFYLMSTSKVAPMSSKSCVPQAPRSASLALMSDNPDPSGRPAQLH